MSSTSGRFLLGLMLGVILGGGASYLLGDLLTMPSTRAAELEALLMPTASSAPVAPTPIEKLSDLAPREEVHTSGKAVNRAMDVPDGKVESLLASIDKPAVEPEHGEGAISGKVTDKEGGGVADVVLRAQRRPDSIGGTSPSDVATGAPELKSLEETVRDAVQRYSESRSNLFETRTDATGAYRFDGLPDGAWQVSAYKKDLVVSALSDAYQVRPGDELDFRAVPVLTIPVSVYLPGTSGTPPKRPSGWVPVRTRSPPTPRTRSVVG